MKLEECVEIKRIIAEGRVQREGRVMIGWEIVGELATIASMQGWSQIACGRNSQGRITTSRGEGLR